MEELREKIGALLDNMGAGIVKIASNDTYSLGIIINYTLSQILVLFKEYEDASPHLASK